MRAAVLQRIGTILDIDVVDVPAAEPTADECLIRVLATALNHRDYWIVQGKYAKIKTPAILGSDICGVVEQVGNSRSHKLVDQTVIVNPSLDWGTDERTQSGNYRILGMPDQGGLAEYVCVPVNQVIGKPQHLSEEQAAALPLAGLTAYRALFVRGQLSADDVVLLTGIGGGVASLALKMSLAHGCRVLVTSGDDSKITKATRIGAVGGVNYKDEKWASNLQAMADKFGGVSLVVDGTGGEQWPDLISLLRPAGRLVTYGATMGNPKNLDVRKIFWKQLTVAGSTMGSPKDFKSMVECVERFQITPEVDSVFPLTDVRSAFDCMARAQQFGKIVVKP